MARENNGPSPKRQNDKEKILIVDDRKENLAALRHVLDTLGVEIIEAGSGNEALAATLDHRFAVAILDVMMPEMDGYELAQHLRSDPGTRQIPIIFLTAVYAEEDRVFKGYEVGAVDYIVKPYNPQMLLSKVRVFLELHRAHMALSRHRDTLEKIVGERIKQQTCLYEISELLSDTLQNLDDTLIKVVGRIPFGWQTPENTCVRVRLDNHTATSRAFRESRWRLTGDISVRGEKRGTVEVFLREGEKTEHGEPFSEEESRLIHAISRQVSQSVERRESFLREQHLNAVLLGIRNVHQLVIREKRRGPLIQSACEGLVRDRGFKGVWIVLTDRLPQRLYEAQSGFDEASFREFASIFQRDEMPPCCKGNLLDANFITVSNPLRNCGTCPLETKHQRDAALTVRLMHEKESFGFMGVSLPLGFAKDSEEQALLQGISRDIAFALHAMGVDAALVKSEKTLQAMFENARDGILLADAGTRRLVFGNTAIERMLGYSHAELLGLSVEDIHPREEMPRVLSEFDLQLSGKKPLAEDIPVQRSDGSIFPADVNAAPLELDGQPYLLGIFRDTTERKLAEKRFKETQAKLVETEKMGALGTLTAGIAHEMNNPMMGILNFVQYCLKKTPEESDLFEVLKDAEKTTKQCIQIVRNLLTFSRIEKQEDEPYEEVALDSIFERVTKILSYRIVREKVDISRQIQEDVSRIRTKVTNLQQVFLNLVGNALDALKESPEKKILLTAQPIGDHVMVEIRDTGSGISKEDQKGIFEPFFTTKPVGKGTGLGLSVSQSIVEGLGGNISCESQENIGTTFKILLPVDPPKDIF